MSSNNADDNESYNEIIYNDEELIPEDINLESSLISVVSSISETSDFRKNIHDSMQSTPFKNCRNHEPLNCKINMMVNDLETNTAKYYANNEYLPNNKHNVNQFYEVKESIKMLNANDQYRALAEQINNAYMEIKDPYSDFTPSNDPISRFNYIMNIVQQPSIKELMAKCSEKEEIIHNLQGERGNLLKCTESLSVIFTSFVSWVVEMSNNLKQKIQCYDIDGEDETELIDPFDKEAIETIVAEYLEIFMNRENENVPDIVNTRFHNYQLKVKGLIESMANRIPNLLENQNNSQTSPIIPQWEDGKITSILQENSDLKNQLENAQKIISTKILPECLIKALNDTKENSIMEIAKIDDKFINEKIKIQNIYENMIESYREELVNKDEELNSKENEIFTLKNDLRFLEKKYKDLKKIHDENVTDFERSIEYFLDENKKLKKDMNKRKGCCDHCVLKNSLQLSNKCVGNSIEMEVQDELNETFEEEQQIYESSIEKEDTQNYIEILQNLIESQQNTIESLNGTARIQNKLIYHQSKSNIINPNSVSSARYPSEKLTLCQGNNNLRNRRTGAGNVVNSRNKNSLSKCNNFNPTEIRRQLNSPSVIKNETDRNHVANNSKPIMKKINKTLRFEEFDQTRPSFHEISQCMKFQTSTPNPKPNSKLNLSLKESVINYLDLTSNHKNGSSLLSTDCELS